MRLEEVAFAAVAPFARRAAADHVSVSPTRDTQWIACFEDGLIVGFAGLIRVGSRYRLKAAWVDPAHRGKGIGTALTDRRLEIAEQACASHVEALSLHPEFFEGRGFSRHGVLSNGAVRVGKVL